MSSTTGFKISLEQSLQMNGFSTECVLMCLSRLHESENDLKHSLQVNGFFIGEF